MTIPFIYVYTSPIHNQYLLYADMIIDVYTYSQEFAGGYMHELVRPCRYTIVGSISTDMTCILYKSVQWEYFEQDVH